MKMHGCVAGGLDDSQFSKPLPWIGLYIAGASLLCCLGMGIDVCRGFLNRKLWFPPKYFSLNATTLTLLGVATKLPVDLNTSMPRQQDQLTKLTGTVLICTVMGNFVPSLGTMGTSDMASNVIALGILVVTVIVNVCIQIKTGVIYAFLPEHAVIMLFMLVLLVIMCSSALIVPTAKKILNQQFDERYKLVEHPSDSEDKYAIKNLRMYVKKFSLMAHTSSPEYVIGRSATCTAAGAFCLIAGLILIETFVRSFIRSSMFCGNDSDYQWSIWLIFIAQALAVGLGTMAPAIRWFNAVSLKSPQGSTWNFKKDFAIEEYWIHTLEKLRELPLQYEIKSRQIRKIAYNSRNIILIVLVKLQKMVVLLSKFVRLLSIFFVGWLSKGVKIMKRLDSIQSSLIESRRDVDLSSFILHLEGEEGLVKLIMTNERKDSEQWTQMGEKNKPGMLIQLLQQCSRMNEGFPGVGEFDSNSITPLAPTEIHNCWSMPIVTLATVAVSLLQIKSEMVEKLVLAINESLKYIRLIEKNLDDQGLVNMREAADIVWLGVDIHHKWFDVHLHRLALEERHTTKIIRRLADIGKSCVLKFLTESNNDNEIKSDPLEWPGKVLAANSLYRVSETILQYYDEKHQTEDNLFEWLCKTISDILGACLTNLPRAIHMECFCCAIEVRESSVRDAAFIFGETEKVLSMLENPEVACHYPENKEHIDEWRNKWQNSPGSSTQRHCDNKPQPCSLEIALSID